MITAPVSTLTIRGVDAALENRLHVVAAVHGRSMEAEVRVILRTVLAQPVGQSGLDSRVHARFAALGRLDLAPPARVERVRAASFEDNDSTT